ncbi:MAG TPA: hypothetical protein PK024_01350, partial [Methanospirillum sp.]|nr:hypothetical protein [Methanospirillum sp.]
PLGITVVDCGSDQSYNITAGFCFNITDVIINGTQHLGPQVSPFTYTFTNVTSDQSIHAMFALKTFPINATAGTGGSISPPGITLVPCGYDQTYTITSSECYNITSVLVDGSPLTGPFTSPHTYTFTNVQESHEINAEFSVQNYTITATAGSNGQISPSGAVSVTCGSNQAFVITANPCYNISSIIIDGSPLSGPFTSPHTYTFTNVQQSHTINAEFAIKNFTITATAGSNGQISPTGTVSVTCGSNRAFVITANPCYSISSIIIDGSSIPGPFTSPYTYTFTNIQQSHTINAEFAIKNFTITATAGPNGQISPAGVVRVNCGSNQAFTITANSGYIIIDVLVNGVSVGVVPSYTFTNVQSDQTIHAIFDSASNWCSISGYVRTSSGVGVPGIRINVWNDDRTILERTGVSQAGGFYTIMHERPPNNYWVDLNCPDTPTWDTTSPADGWINHVQLNPGGKCSAVNQNFIGRIIP